VLLRQLLGSEYLRGPAVFVEVLLGRGGPNGGDVFVEPFEDVGVGLGRLGQSRKCRQQQSHQGHGDRCSE